ncbi:MAG: aminoglycoside phosphotransferase family protein [Alicyclobacillus sp.]|nr:aminoglycoside phosphotransferase family protein [Alicyclobacillus sp.]
MSGGGQPMGRTVWVDGDAVVKHMSDAEWMRLTWVRAHASDRLRTALPRVHSAHPAETADGWKVRMALAGTAHLETVPAAVTAALRLLDDIRGLELPAVYAQPICLRSLQAAVADTVCPAEITRAFGGSADVQRRLQEALRLAASMPIEIDPLAPAHGDFHPRNLRVQADGRLVVLDWEFFGRHSVFRDIYALVDMCYPDAAACWTLPARARMRQAGLAAAARWSGMDLPSLTAGYRWYALLERLVECRQIAADLMSGRRAKPGLLAQAAFVVQDLAGWMEQVHQP